MRVYVVDTFTQNMFRGTSQSAAGTCMSNSHAGASDCMQSLGDRVGERVDFGGIET
jgi:hypothetical protein